MSQQPSASQRAAFSQPKPPHLSQGQHSRQQVDCPYGGHPAMSAYGAQHRAMKRPRFGSPQQSQPGSPAATHTSQGPYANSAASTPGTPTTNGLGSPSLQQISFTPSQQYQSSYAATQTGGQARPQHPQQPTHSTQQNPFQVNGRSTSHPMSYGSGSGLSLPAPAAPQSAQMPTMPQTQIPITQPQPQFSNATFAIAASAPGSMGPPTMPPPTYMANNDSARPTATAASKQKTMVYDIGDSLLGTGINLEEEERALNEYHSAGLNTYAAHGSKSFHGAGTANQAPEQSEELPGDKSDRVWNEAARRRTLSMLHESPEFFLQPASMHAKLQRICNAHGLEIVQDLKPDSAAARFQHPNAMEARPEVRDYRETAADGTVLRTRHLSTLPKASMLYDQLDLLSQGTKELVLSLMSEADKIARLRQSTSHGKPSSEYEDISVQLAATRRGSSAVPDSAVSPRTNHLKRSAEDMSNGLPTPESVASLGCPLWVESFTKAQNTALDIEQARMMKRQKLRDEASAKGLDGSGAPGAGSSASGTAEVAGSKVAGKKPSKKAEPKAKRVEASSSSVNSTLGKFAGSKKYAWMLNLQAKGNNTPRSSAAGLSSGQHGGTAVDGNGQSYEGVVSQPNAWQLGKWREDSEVGMHIQMRDWVNVLEDRDICRKALQQTYVRMDKSKHGGHVVVPTPDAPSVPSAEPTPNQTPSQTPAQTPVETPTLHPL